MFTKQIKTTARHAHSSIGHASLFFTVMEIEYPKVKFVVASVFGISSKDGIFTDTKIEKNGRDAVSWAIGLAKHRLGNRVQMGPHTKAKGKK